MGAGMATIASVDLINDPSLAFKTSLYTYGSPRVGNQDFAKCVNEQVKENYRFVKKDDSVTDLPKRFPFRYSHTGDLIYWNNSKFIEKGYVENYETIWYDKTIHDTYGRIFKYLKK